MSACPYRGWPDDRPALPLSEHRTADGPTMWTRCRCGSLQTRRVPGGTATVVARGRPARRGGGRRERLEGRSEARGAGEC